MTDPELVAKKLALVETCVQELRSLAHPDAIRHWQPAAGCRPRWQPRCETWQASGM